MLGMGWPEILVIGIVAMLVFGPERLPDFARQAAGFLRTARQMANSAKSDIRSQLGDDFKDINLRDLDPRNMVRDVLAEDHTTPAAVKPTRILRPGEVPPYDPEST